MKKDDYSIGGLVVCIGLTLAGCDGRIGAAVGGISDERIEGSAQKGPFLFATDVDADELLSDGRIGLIQIETEAFNSRGGFAFTELPLELNQVRLRAEGRFFNEVTGTVSSVERRLDALVDVDALDNANINLYTHITAGRTRRLMGEGESFADAQSQAQSEWNALTGTTAPAYRLDLLTGFAGSTEIDSANLLLFSAAVLKQGSTQSDINAIRDDFADDGAIDGAGQAAFNDIALAAETPDLLASARTNLETEFSVTPPTADTSNFSWLRSACEKTRDRETRVFCEGQRFGGNHVNDSREWVAFVPEISGHYAFELAANPAYDNANTGACSWTLYASNRSTVLGDSTAAGRLCPVAAVSTRRLSAGDTYYIQPMVEQDDPGGPPARFQLFDRRISDGLAVGHLAKKLPINQDVEGVVGVLGGVTTESFYRFKAGPGLHTIAAHGFPCGGGYGGLRLKLYEHAGATGFHTLIAHDWDEGTCTQAIQARLVEGREYYLKVENRLGNRTHARPASERVDYTLSIRTR